jgi:endopolyphosphatase
MKDLTIGSWLTLARKLGDGQKEKLRKRFRNYMTVGEDAEVET